MRQQWSPVDSTEAIMAELKAGFQAIDTRLDTLSDRFDNVSEHLDGHATRIEGGQTQNFKIEVGNVDALRCLERVEGLLKTVAAEIEDLDAWYRCNYVRITGLAKTTNIGLMDLFIEK
ncbi:hypothetical protein NDU88_002462 [Pleurodeles waltl]|uniref:Uncharacterized protein n=1 Tax=Pleurodeles waltl TaxID=8319 RepID=A0AAV7LCF2_PLEWA|nr:hypothetical protein NDU88_002462 [Pleurodeles waltl]